MWKKTLFVTKPFQLQDLISNYIYFLLFNYFDATCSSENLVLDQIIISHRQLIFFYNLITCLLDIFLILWGENLSWILLILIFFYPQVKYSGGACDDANIGYFIGFSVVFFFVSAVSATQLVCNKYCRKLDSCIG